MSTDLEWADKFDEQARELEVDKDLDGALRVTAADASDDICDVLRSCASYKLGYTLAQQLPSVLAAPQAVRGPYVLVEVQRGWVDGKNKGLVRPIKQRTM